MCHSSAGKTRLLTALESYYAASAICPAETKGFALILQTTTPRQLQGFLDQTGLMDLLAKACDFISFYQYSVFLSVFLFFTY